MNKYRLVTPIDDSDRNQNTVLGFPGKSYIRFICLFVSKCVQFYFYSGQTDRGTLCFIYIDLEERLGTKKDADSMEKLLKEIGFDKVHVHDDQTDIEAKTVSRFQCN